MSLRTVVSCLILHAVFSFAQASWNTHVIHNNTHGTASVHVCDLDNDSDLDVLGAVLEDNQIVWWRNEGGYPIVWTKFYIGSYFWSAFSVYAADIDNDGDQDVIGAAGDGDEIAWWSNNGGNPSSGNGSRPTNGQFLAIRALRGLRQAVAGAARRT